MARRSLEQQLADKKKKEEQLAAERRQLEARLRQQDRKDETRRDILVGAMYRNRAKHDASFARDQQAELAKFLVRDIDRALFGMPVLVKTETSNSDAQEDKSQAA